MNSIPWICFPSKFIFGALFLSKSYFFLGKQSGRVGWVRLIGGVWVILSLMSLMGMIQWAHCWELQQNPWDSRWSFTFSSLNMLILTWKVVPIFFLPHCLCFFSRGSWKNIQLKLGKLRETKFGHVEAKASSAVPTCGVYLATWPVKRVRIFAKSGLDNC